MEDLKEFRSHHMDKKIQINNTIWEYYDIGDENSESAIVFLHGTTGSREIFWLQMRVLKSTFRIISFNLPPIGGVERLSKGIYEILTTIGVRKVVLVGTSFGGYLAQYFSSKYKMVEKLVLSNTFITTELYHQRYKRLLSFEKLIPFFLIKRIMKKSLLTIEFDVTRNYLLDQLNHNLSKKTLMARLKSFVTDEILEKAPLDPQNQILIIETIADPLVPKELQEDLKKAYPQATVRQFKQEANHFPYLTKSDEYNRILMEFLTS